MALECNHNFRLDQMVWAQFSDNGGFWPAIISRDKKEPQKRWYIGNNIHVQFVSPPFVRACNQVIQVTKLRRILLCKKYLNIIPVVMGLIIS